MKHLLYCSFCILVILASCKKQDKWLDIKQNKSDIVPKTIGDFQSILDNQATINNAYTSIGLLGCDNYYLPPGNVNSIPSEERNCYFWSPTIFEGGFSSDYSYGYILIELSNIVLDGLNRLTPNSSEIYDYNNVKGQALFFRSIFFYNLAMAFGKPYVEATADVDLGISVRDNSDVNHIEQRSSVRQTYNHIINDLKKALPLLPITPLYKTRPSKPAAYALLSKTYLVMQDYSNAKKYADSALLYLNTILNFNSNLVSLSNPYRFPDFNKGNPEVIFYATGLGRYAIVPDENFNSSYVDSVLYNSYSDNDLRKLYFYNLVTPTHAKYKGTYTGSSTLFAGIATNEIYLIAAECNARLDNMPIAKEQLNALLINRFKTGTYIPYTSSDPDSVLRKILEERRKELPFTSQIRWEDLRRLNLDPKFQTQLFRFYDNKTFTLLPNSNLYTYPIPQKEIDLADIQQNDR